MALKEPPSWRYICLSILFVLVCAYQVRATIYYLPEFFHLRTVGWPFIPAYTGGHPLATFALPNALAAGVEEGDILVAINGRPFTGTAVFGEAIARATPVRSTRRSSTTRRR